jgi:hypothetical protein
MPVGFRRGRTFGMATERRHYNHRGVTRGRSQVFTLSRQTAASLFDSLTAHRAVATTRYWSLCFLAPNVHLGIPFLRRANTAA